MPYLVPLVVAIVLNTADRTVTRATLRRHGDRADEFLLVYQLTSTLLTVPFAALALLRPGHPAGVPSGEVLLLVLAAITCWSIYSVSAFRSSALLELSVAATISRLRLILAAFFGVVFFGETVSATHAIGLAVLLVAYIPLTQLPREQLNRKGLAYAAASTVAITLALTTDKALTAWFDPAVILFLGFAGTTLTGFALNKGTSTAALRPVLLPAVLAGTAGAAGYYGLVVAMTEGPVGVILPVYQSSAFIYVLIGIVLLGETSGWRRKVLSAAISLLGAALVLSS
ncbi:EamA family transporter [Streptomyces sp. M92]|uniref:EamA family transporter n=1 Tax=Streptomyces sp. M92 TaxID=2944250 RepID=UPI00234BC336|nr:EamA family transporter [Streptomyces sp. M92]WCN07399.1 EamA family transporter [Streptomyces sp. M92]